MAADVRFVALPSELVAAWQAGGPDAHGHAPERHVSDGDGNPCRHCLDDIAAGEPFLILAHRPFPASQPYAETGPIFVHAGPCTRYAEDDGAPPTFLRRERVLMRGYGADDRIVYGTGGAVPSQAIAERARDLLGRADVAYVHVRSASYNCFQCRIERAVG
jgi:hypothetical protein